MSMDPAIQETRASSSVLCAMLNDVARTLKADERYVFSRPECVVITEDDGDIDTKISQILGTLGLCVTVMFLKATAASGSLPGPRFGNASIIAEISELSITNRSESGLQITALEAAEQAALILHQARMPSGRMLLVTDIAKYPQMPEPADNCYHGIITTGEVTLRRKE
jgi:hypothetical protein